MGKPFGLHKLLVPLVALGVLAAPVATATMVAAPANATGNNGTIKVHAEGSDPGTESNEPKVCAFNLEFFGFDEGTDGYVTFEVQGGDGPTGVAAGPFEVGTANADGYFDSDYFNVEGAPAIQNGHYKVTLFGKFNGEPNYADEKAKSKVFKVDCQPTEEPPPPPTIKECPEVLGTTVVTPSNLQGFDFSQTRATGHYEFLENGLRIWTEGSTSTDKVAGYKAVNVPLVDVGDPSLNYTNTAGGLPGLQLVIDFDANGTPDGILVGEEVYGDNWWLTNSSQQFVKDGAPHTGGGQGSEWYGTLNEWLAEFPDAVVKQFGFSLGSGVKGDGIITKITFACTEYTFTTDKPKPGTATASSDVCVKPGESTGVATVTVTNTDDDTNASVTYDVTLNGVVKQVTVADGQSGSVSFSGLAAGDYAWSVTGPDGTKVNGMVKVNACAVVPPPPVPPTPPTPVPPTPVPPTPVPPTPTPEPVVDNPSASVNASCVTARFGEARVVLNNKRSTVKNTFRIVRFGHDKVVTLKAGAKKVLNLTGLKVGSVVKVKSGGKLLAKTRVPHGCQPTPVPDTGFRMAASST